MTGDPQAQTANPASAREPDLLDRAAAELGRVTDILLGRLAARDLKDPRLKRDRLPDEVEELTAAVQVLRVLAMPEWSENDVRLLDAYLPAAERSEAFGDEFEEARFRIRSYLHDAEQHLEPTMPPVEPPAERARPLPTAPASPSARSRRRAPEPTAQDLRNAACRADIAARQAAEYGEAQRLALAALGSGWTPWMKLTLLDSDHRRTGDTTPVATVFKVYRGAARLTEQSVFLRRMPDGSVRQAATYEPLFGELLTEKHPSRTIAIGGQTVPADRYELCWSALTLYSPQSADQLAAARVKRAERVVEKSAQEQPLFAEQIRSGEWQPGQSRRSAP